MNGLWLHVVAVIGNKDGTGFTVTVTVKAGPVQLPDNGVTIYVAVCAEFVGLVSVPVIFAAADPAAPPVIPPVTAGADQLYVVPAGTMSVPLTGVTVNITALQVVAVLAAIEGTGLTVTVTVKGEPVQLPAVGVTEYVAV